MAVKEAANKYIPTTKVIQKPFHAFSFKATKLHQALKLSNKARKLISSPPSSKSIQTIADKANAILQQIEQLTDYSVPILQNRTYGQCHIQPPIQPYQNYTKLYTRLRTLKITMNIETRSTITLIGDIRILQTIPLP